MEDDSKPRRSELGFTFLDIWNTDSLFLSLAEIKCNILFFANNKPNISVHKIIASLISRLLIHIPTACNIQQSPVLLMQNISSSYQHGNSWVMMSWKNQPCYSPYLAIIPRSVAHSVFCTALNPLLALKKDNENTNDDSNSSSQVTGSLSHSDPNTPFQLFKEQIVQRREKETSAMLAIFLSKGAE